MNPRVAPHQTAANWPLIALAAFVATLAAQSPPPRTAPAPGRQIAMEGTRANLAALAQHPDLDTLEIRGIGLEFPTATTSDLTDADFELLTHHRRLRVLRIFAQPQVTGAGLRALRGLAMLEELALVHVDVGDAHLAALQELPNLRRLDLSFSLGFGREGLAALAKLPSLRTLSLRGCAQLADADLTVLGTMRHIQELDLRDLDASQWARCRSFTTRLDAADDLLNLATTQIGEWVTFSLPLGQATKVVAAPSEPQPWQTRRAKQRKQVRPPDSLAGNALGRALGQLPALESLRLGPLSMDHDIARQLLSRPRLRELHVHTELLTTDVLAALPRGLRNLHVTEGLNDQQCAALAARTRELTKLACRGGRDLTTTGLAALLTLPALEHLDVAECTRLGVLTLPGVLLQASSLRELDLTGIKLLDEQIAAIRRRLPNAVVTWAQESPTAHFPRN